MTDCKYRNGEQCQKVIDYNERFKAEFCDHCCDGCKHAIEMTCSIVCVGEIGSSTVCNLCEGGSKQIDKNIRESSYNAIWNRRYRS